ncbi:hypothetical protein KL86SPO_20141 [uncultured Sporomusa sp.]|uniref:Uncharacterized protein n=1 Tax=uncultured Sporomusa sp. TaxID=307249 RepID=A0A212LM50_9FIRM|nr:hypothetical protein KL86SPO_20141 [uncultured Sporomusa sp.]
MAHISSRVFLQLPLGNFAGTAGMKKQFIAQTAGSPAMLRILYLEFFIAMGSNFCYVADNFHTFDAVQFPAS